MNVSSYVYGTSFYHRFDVRPKLFFSLVFIVEAFIVDSAVGLLLLFFLPMALMQGMVGVIQEVAASSGHAGPLHTASGEGWDAYSLCRRGYCRH